MTIGEIHLIRHGGELAAIRQLAGLSMLSRQQINGFLLQLAVEKASISR